MKTPKVSTSTFEPDMTPIIDVVFQLVAFFMIALSFENTEADERVRLPKDMIARPPEVRPEYELILNVGYRRTATGRKLDTNPYVFHNNATVDVRDLGPILVQERRNFESTNRSEVRTTDRVTVIIRADDDLPTGVVQEVVRHCQQVGFSRFSLRAADVAE